MAQSRQLTHAQIASPLQELIGSPPPTGRGAYMPEMGKWAAKPAVVLKAYRGQLPVAATTST